MIRGAGVPARIRVLPRGQRQKVIEAGPGPDSAGYGPFWRLAQIYITMIIYGVCIGGSSWESKGKTRRNGSVYLA